MHGSDGHGHDGHHDGLGGHSGFGHSFGLFDLDFGAHNHPGQATYDAIFVGHAFGHVGHSPHVDSHVAGHAPFEAPAGTMEGNGPSFDGPVDLDHTRFAVLGVGLGYRDWEAVMREAALNNSLVERLNLMLTPPIVRPAKRFDELLPINYVAPPAVTRNPQQPKHFYPGAVGSTTLSRTNWQIGERSLLDKLAGRPASEIKNVRTTIEVEITEWYYAEPADFEVRFAVRVLGGKNENELRTTLKAARGLCSAMLKAFQKTPPSAASLAWRREHQSA